MVKRLKNPDVHIDELFMAYMTEKGIIKSEETDDIDSTTKNNNIFDSLTEVKEEPSRVHHNVRCITCKRKSTENCVLNSCFHCCAANNQDGLLCESHKMRRLKVEEENRLIKIALNGKKSVLYKTFVHAEEKFKKFGDTVVIWCLDDFIHHKSWSEGVLELYERKLRQTALRKRMRGQISTSTSIINSNSISNSSYKNGNVYNNSSSSIDMNSNGYKASSINLNDGEKLTAENQTMNNTVSEDPHQYNILNGHGIISALSKTINTTLINKEIENLDSNSASSSSSSQRPKRTRNVVTKDIKRPISVRKAENEQEPKGRCVRVYRATVIPQLSVKEVAKQQKFLAWLDVKLQVIADNNKAGEPLLGLK